MQFSGRLELVAPGVGLGLGGQRVDLLLGNEVLATATTDAQGGYSLNVAFHTTGTRSIVASAYRGTPLEVRSAPLSIEVEGLSGATAVAGGHSHTCALVSGGQVRCWGRNWWGQLGDGTSDGGAQTLHRTTPVAVSGLSGATAVSAGQSHTCALVSGGQVRCWGWNQDGQLGAGTPGPEQHLSTPVRVTDLHTATAVAAGTSHTCALVSGGKVECWGGNRYGQLGDGTTTTDRTTIPRPVSGLSGATALAAAGDYTCALVGGQVRCWGRNETGQLGDGTTTNRSTPVAVSGLSGATALAAGQYHACALVSGGQVRCWGANFYGQLGDRTTTNRTTPVAVWSLSGATTLALGTYHTCALVSGGEGRCWGFNGDRQLGDGTTSTYWDRTRDVVNLTGATALTAGNGHTCAVVFSQGEGRCWGHNSNGQLGDGTTTNRPIPVGVRA